MSRPRRAIPLGRWIPLAQAMRMTKRPDGRLLACIVNMSGADVVALAVETAAATAGMVEEVLEDHRHKSIGTFTSLARAQAASERYARQWRKETGAPSTPPCACDELPDAKTPPSVEGGARGPQGLQAASGASLGAARAPRPR